MPVHGQRTFCNGAVVVVLVGLFSILVHHSQAMAHYKFQTSQIKIHGTEERRRGGQAPLHHCKSKSAQSDSTCGNYVNNLTLS